MTMRRASCTCGGLTAETAAEPVRISMCHCLDCQRRTGSTFGAQAWFPADEVRVDGERSIYTRTADSGNRIAFHFCPNCGATVFYRPEAMPDVTAIPIGAFADPDFPPPRVSVYEARRHAWVATPEGVEHYD